MPQRRQNLRVASRIGFAVCSLMIAIAPSACFAQQRSWEDDSSVPANSQTAETMITADLRVPQLDASSILSATLCFAVGFAACLLVVHYMLPALVHVQCVEIVRQYVDSTRREADVRVVLLDREIHEPLLRPRRATTAEAPGNAGASFETRRHLRVDKSNEPDRSTRFVSSDSRGDDAPDSMLSQIYEQNLHLRDQLRKQSGIIKPSKKE